MSRRIIQSPSKFCLPFINASIGLFPRWIGEIQKMFLLANFPTFPAALADDPLSHDPLSLLKSLCHRLIKIWQPEKGGRKKNEGGCAQLAGTRRCGAVGRLSTRPSTVAATTTVWSPSPTSSRLPLISACASPIHRFDVVMPFLRLLNI